MRAHLADLDNGIQQLVYSFAFVICITLALYYNKDSEFIHVQSQKQHDEKAEIPATYTRFGYKSKGPRV